MWVKVGEAMKVFWVLFFLSVVLSACSLAPTTTASPANTIAPPSATPTLLPSATPLPVNTPTLTPPPPDPKAELQAILTADMLLDAVNPGVSFSAGIEAVVVKPLKNTGGGESLWMAHSLGSRNQEPIQNHFVAIYAHDEESWLRMGYIELDEVDFLDENSVTLVPFDSDHSWMQVQSKLVTHGECFDLLRFDGTSLQRELSNCLGTRGAGELRDMNADGLLEVLLNLSEYYVFCYDCSLYIPIYEIWRWDGSELVVVPLTDLPSSAPAPLRQQNNLAVKLAKAELWKDAQQAIQRASSIDVNDPVVAWNAILINFIAAERSKQVDMSPYPLLGHIFFGDYGAAYEMFQPYSPEEIFSPESPLLVGTPAYGAESQLRDWIFLFTEKALEVDPELAIAYFLRGWAAHLAEPGSPSVLKDVKRALSLDPANAFYSYSLGYLKSDNTIYGQPISP